MKSLHTKQKPQADVLACKVLKLERRGKYLQALAELGEIWSDTTQFPETEGLDASTAAEIILRCGSLVGHFGDNHEVAHAQQKSRDLLTNARQRFIDLKNNEKVAECEAYLAFSYWRTGELKEAEAWSDESLLHELKESNTTRLYVLLIRSLINLLAGRHRENIHDCSKLEEQFQTCGDDFLNGSLYGNLGISYDKLSVRPQAVKCFELARFYHQKSGHKIYFGTAENNLAMLYCAEKKFARAHASAESAARIFKRIKDVTREGFSWDTTAQIFFAEAKYLEALAACEKGIAILRQCENSAYLAETLLTRAKIELYLDDFKAAFVTLIEAYNITKLQAGEAAANKLVEEFTRDWKELRSPVSNENVLETDLEDDLQIVLPPLLSHYLDYQGIWINNSHLEKAGLQKGSLAILVKESVKRGDLVAIAEKENGAVSCGFYDSDFGIVCLEGSENEPRLFNEQDIEILGKIIGVCSNAMAEKGNLKVTPLGI